ncbi:hypothetical protein BDF22DRAFT_657452 [Syncephalis plumigaleata]|nr:hypothetical protein BDF22DRAFT_657452 [Syncephalis plumigaleata]
MKFSTVLAIAVAVVALTSLVAVEASPVLEPRKSSFQWILLLTPILKIKQTRQGHHQVDIIGIQVKNVLVQDPLVSMPFKSLFLVGAVAGKKDAREIMVQGDHVNKAKQILASYGIPERYVEVDNKSKK